MSPTLNITGVHECKADAKGRVALPAALRKQLAPVLSEGFVLKRSVFQPCLELYPMQSWNRIMAKVNGLNRFVAKNNEFIRRFSAGVKLIELDESGRLLLPKDLLTYASMGANVVMAAAVDILEIWDKAAYEKAVDPSSGDFAALAEEVMGSLRFDQSDPGHGVS